MITSRFCLLVGFFVYVGSPVLARETGLQLHDDRLSDNAPIEVSARHEYSTFDCTRLQGLLKRAESISVTAPMIAIVPKARVSNPGLSMADMRIEAVGSSGIRSWQPDEVGRVGFESEDLSSVRCGELRVNRPKHIVNFGLIFSLRWKENGHYSTFDLLEACKQYQVVIDAITRPLLPGPSQRQQCSAWRFLYRLTDPIPQTFISGSEQSGFVSFQRAVHVKELYGEGMKWNVVEVALTSVGKANKSEIRITPQPFIIIPKFIPLVEEEGHAE